jgi:hypothetical protein
MKKHILNTHYDNIYILYIISFEFERIRQKINNHKIKVQYFPGVNGKEKLSEQFDEYLESNKARKSKSYMKTVGAFGHVHSMINIMKNAIEKKYKKILILEPDIYFIENFADKVKLYLDLDYKLLYFGASQNNWAKIENQPDMRNMGMYYAKDTCGTFAVALDCSVFNEYLTILNKLLNPSDVCLYEIQNKYPKQCLVTYPNLISCDLTKSTTATRWKSQLDMSRKFKWDSIYEIYDRLPYLVNVDSIYKIVIEINHMEKGKCHFKILDTNAKDITPTISIPDLSLVEQKVRMCNDKPKLCDK